MGTDRLPELLAWSDFAVIAAPQTPETTGWFHAATLAHLRPSSYLINIGRGAIVILDDLVAALAAGRLAGAALDVYEVEPLPADHPLWDFPNVILTPHTAGYSPVIAARTSPRSSRTWADSHAASHSSRSLIKPYGSKPHSWVAHTRSLIPKNPPEPPPLRKEGTRSSFPISSPFAKGGLGG